MHWALKPVSQQVTSGLVSRRIQRGVHLGTYLPGDRLPPERDLASDLGVSRVTLREALRALEGGGYITARRGAQGGSFIADLTSLLDAAETRFVRHPDERDALLTFWRVNWTAAAELAAVHARPFDRKRFVAVAAPVLDDDTTRRREVVGFLLAVAEASGNEFLLRALEDGLDACFVRLPPRDYRHGGQPIDTLRRDLVDTIVRGDPAAARFAAETYASAINAYIVERPHHRVTALRPARSRATL